MDILFIARDGAAESIVGQVVLATQAAAAGRRTGIIFSANALVSVAQRRFIWGREFWPQEVRWAMADTGAEMEMPVAGRGQFRALDPEAMMIEARMAGVKLYACPPWWNLLRESVNLPEGMVPLEFGEALDLLDDARQIVGAL